MRYYILGLTVFLAACSDTPPSDVTLYTAEAILTQNPAQPSAEAVAVRGGQIVGVGDLSELRTAYKGAALDETYAGKTILPGLIDPHVHMTLGAMMYGLDWVPPWDMPRSDGVAQGLPDKISLLRAVTAAHFAKDDGSPLILWGYHNLIQGDITRADLDAIAPDRPLILWHYSGHDFYLNSAAISLFKLKPEMAELYEGIGLNADGTLNGRIFEDAVAPLLPKIGPYLLNPKHVARGYAEFEALLRRGGVTTVAEMGYGLFGRPLEDGYIAQHYTAEDSYRLYKVPEHRSFTAEFGADAPAEIVKMSADPIVLPQVKLFTDAAFYSQTMKLSAPGYLAGQSAGTDGLWVTEPDELAEVMRPYWEAGLDIHIHSNGDAAQTATLAAFAEMPEGQAGQRLIIEHAGLLTPEQITRAADLGIGLSAASHYVSYMGEDYAEAIGERVAFITPLRSAVDAGMRTTLHSDAPLAPPMPLVAAAKHITRTTQSGRVQTPSERLSPEQALRAITLDAAWSLGLENEIGSIEVGKRADFTVLSANPLRTPIEAWAEIEVAGILLDGIQKE